MSAADPPVPVRALRRRRIEAHVDVRTATVLEIGALDSPTYPPELGVDVRYLDWFDRDELRAMHKGANRSLERMVQPDYVVKDKRFAGAIDERFDLVIANHVVEHVPDPIAWLGQLHTVVRRGGLVFLAVPDRRYTFDVLRRASSAVDLLRSHLDDLDKPDVAQVVESFFHHRGVVAADLWAPTPPTEKLDRKRFTLREALARARRFEGSYVDAHCHVFTCESFSTVMRDLAESDYVAWDVAALHDVRPGDNEFHALLRRRAAPALPA